MIITMTPTSNSFNSSKIIYKNKIPCANIKREITYVFLLSLRETTTGKENLWAREFSEFVWNFSFLWEEKYTQTLRERSSSFSSPHKK